MTWNLNNVSSSYYDYTPVSYTHLDVYKRQVHVKNEFWFTWIANDDKNKIDVYTVKETKTP